MVNFAIDLDGVCFDLQDIVDWHNKLYGTSFNKKEFLSPGLCDKIGIPSKIFEQRITSIY